MAKENAKLNKRFGARVRALRQSCNLSQEDLAHAADLDRSYVGQVERGERNPSLKNIAKFANAFGISLSELLKEV